MISVSYFQRHGPQAETLLLQRADVCINPLVVNAVTQGSYPLKIDEYLTMSRRGGHPHPHHGAVCGLYLPGRPA